MSCYVIGATTEVEALKKAVAEAEKRAAKEQATRENHEAQVIEVQQELQEAIGSARPWSRI